MKCCQVTSAFGNDNLFLCLIKINFKLCLSASDLFLCNPVLHKLYSLKLPIKEVYEIIHICNISLIGCQWNKNGRNYKTLLLTIILSTCSKHIFFDLPKLLFLVEHLKLAYHILFLYIELIRTDWSLHLWFDNIQAHQCQLVITTKYILALKENRLFRKICILFTSKSLEQTGLNNPSYVGL